MPSSPDLIANIDHPKVKSGKWESPYHRQAFIPFDQITKPEVLLACGVIQSNLKPDLQLSVESVSTYHDNDKRPAETGYYFVLYGNHMPTLTAGKIWKTTHVDLEEIFNPQTADYHSTDKATELSRAGTIGTFNSGRFLRSPYPEIEEVTDDSLPYSMSHIRVHPFLFKHTQNLDAVGEDPRRAILQLSLTDHVKRLATEINSESATYFFGRIGYLKEITTSIEELTEIDKAHLTDSRRLSQLLRRFQQLPSSQAHIF